MLKGVSHLLLTICFVCLFLHTSLYAEMEGAKEKMRQERGEKDSNEADGRRSDDTDEDDKDKSDVVALVWQERYEDNLSFPIMHWEALSLRIAELEKQEELKKEQMAMVRGYGVVRGG